MWIREGGKNLIFEILLILEKRTNKIDDEVADKLNCLAWSELLRKRKNDGSGLYERAFNLLIYKKYC